MGITVLIIKVVATMQLKCQDIIYRTLGHFKRVLRLLVDYYVITPYIFVTIFGDNTQMKGKVAILTKDHELIEEVGNILGTEEITVCSDPEEVGEVKDIDVLLLDIDSSGISNLDKLKDTCFVIVITSEKGTRYLIESMTFGAFDCVFRPLENSNLAGSVNRALGIKSEISGHLRKFH